ncbi:MAG: molybdenum cofactor guanylyltransferase, partial [Acidobacteriaceae bacterium]|nr:molybdenum cofactor guanylyltransferase [Acidobacteriaceae bacterium]
MHAAGFVLAGGQSRRMGRDKAMLPWGSGVLLEDVAKRVAVAAGNVAVVGDPAAYGHLGIECLADLHPGLGPLSGIEAALASNRGTCNLIVACDMPGLPVEHLRALLRAAREGVSRCVVTIDGAEKIHPLCAVYFDNC